MENRSERITINGKSYVAAEMDFNFICELGAEGIAIEELSKKILPAIRVYVAYCMGTTTDVAGEEINQHVINGGDFDDIASVFSKKAEESDFFLALNKTTKKENPKRNTKKKEAEVSE